MFYLLFVLSTTALAGKVEIALSNLPETLGHIEKIQPVLKSVATQLQDKAAEIYKMPESEERDLALLNLEVAFNSINQQLGGVVLLEKIYLAEAMDKQSKEKKFQNQVVKSAVAVLIKAGCKLKNEPVDVIVDLDMLHVLVKADTENCEMPEKMEVVQTNNEGIEELKGYSFSCESEFDQVKMEGKVKGFRLMEESNLTAPVFCVQKAQKKEKLN